VLDGEVVASDADGRPNFARLHVRWTRSGTIRLWAFDLLAFNGHNLRLQPLVKRQARLRPIGPVNAGIGARSRRPHGAKPIGRGENWSSGRLYRYGDITIYCATCRAILSNSSRSAGWRPPRRT
jgi:hypothetical protein